MKKVQNWILILLFVGVIFGFTGWTLVSGKKDFSERENRSLAQMPSPSFKTVIDGSFEKDYESYLSDQFVERDTWIGLKTETERALGKQEINGVYFAEDGYLIEAHEGSFTSSQASANITLLQSFLEKYQEQFSGNHLSVMIVPNAVDILDYKLPFYAPDAGEEEYLSRIKEIVPEGAWFDAGRVLRRHPDQQMFYKTDHHWTTLGAYYVYQAWAKSRGLSPLSLSAYTRDAMTTAFRGTIESKVGGKTDADAIERFVPKEEPQNYAYQLIYNQGSETSDDLYHTEVLDTKDKYAVFFGGNQPVIQAKVENSSSRKLLIIKDSYANCFAPFAFHEFSQVDMVDIRYFNSSLEEFIQNGDYTDLLFLYNASGFAEDTSLMKLLN